MLNRLVKAGFVVWLLASPAFVHAAGASAQEVRALISQAREALQLAADLGHAWSNTDDYIASAETLLAASELEAALTAARRALLTARASVEQARAEATAWRSRVPAP